MPLKNTHTARQSDPARFKEFRKTSPEDGLSLVLGIDEEGKSEVQSIHADASQFDKAEFESWLEEHDFETDNVIEATQKSFEAFSRWIKIDKLEKAENEENENAVKIGGICSTVDMDFEGERIDQDGMDWTYFLKHGWFNYEHRQGADAVLGHPTSIEISDDGNSTRVEGLLYTLKPLAREIYETAVAIQKAGGDRSLGFSVEGQVLERNPQDQKHVKKARVLNVAITNAPVNPHTSLELLAKNLTGASAGYQSPSIPDADASLSALVKQDLEKRASSKTYSAKKISKEELTKRARAQFESMSEEDLDAFVNNVLKIAKNLRKN